jgi:L-lactate utilization protein LutB
MVLEMWSDVKEWHDVKRWHLQKKIERMLAALRKNGFDAIYISTRKEAAAKVLELIPPNALVGVGGSVTVRELGLLEILKSRGNMIADHWEARHKELTPEQVMKVRKLLLNSDVLLTSTNAVTETGNLVNIDHAGQRVAAMIFGPEKVVIVAGVNKIVRDVDEALERIKNVAAPMNAKRLNMNVPCTVSGFCSDCDSHDRICNVTTIIERKPVHTDVTVILIGETLGY